MQQWKSFHPNQVYSFYNWQINFKQLFYLLAFDFYFSIRSIIYAFQDHFNDKLLNDFDIEKIIESLEHGAFQEGVTDNLEMFLEIGALGVIFL